MNIKGFDRDLCCRGMQFEVGKEYRIENGDKPLKLCTDTVFHYCRSMKDVLEFYPMCEGCRYCEIEVLGHEVSDGQKCGSDHIRILREIKGDELNSLFGITENNTGYWCSGDGNTGDYNRGDKNTGKANDGSYNTGNGNAGNWNTGNDDEGNDNTGDSNRGNENTGDGNTGNRNTGCMNAGEQNTGDFNSGHFNTGDFNSASGTTGFFCTEEDPEIRLFNKPCGMTRAQFRASVYWKALHSVKLPLMTWKEEGNPEMQYYGNACLLWWKRMTDENKRIILSMPNFDADIFYEITGVRIDGDCAGW